MNLVIGFGNELRGDDGLGPCLARRIGERNQSGVRAIAVQQLAPELADLLAECRAVLFVDAAQDAGGIQLTALTRSTRTASAHALDPAGLLALTEALHARTPPAWLLSVPATCFDFQLGLSAKGERRAIQAFAWIERWLAEVGS